MSSVGGAPEGDDISALQLFPSFDSGNDIKFFGAGATASFVQLSSAQQKALQLRLDLICFISGSELIKLIKKKEEMFG